MNLKLISGGRNRYGCVACGEGAPGRSVQCEACGAEGTIVLLEEEPEPPDHAPLGRRARSLLSISHRPRPKVTSGRPAWDEALGGGFTRPSSVLVYGPPGVGKSTSLLRIGVRLACELGGTCLYGSSEMPAEHIRQVVHDLGIPPSQWKRLFVQDSPDAEDVQADLEALSPAVIVWDSIQRYRFRGELGETELRNVVTDAIEMGQAARAVTILVSQVTKDGIFVGERGIAHGVDVEIELTKEGEGLVRVTCASKNRFAKTPRSGVEALRAT